MLSFKVALNDRQYLKYTASVMKEVRDMNPELEKQATNGSCSRSERVFFLFLLWIQNCFCRIFSTAGSRITKLYCYKLHWGDKKFGLEHISPKMQSVEFSDIKFSTLYNLGWTIHQNLTSKTHLHDIIFDVKFLTDNLQGGTVMSNLTFCIFDMTVYDLLMYKQKIKMNYINQ